MSRKAYLLTSKTSERVSRMLKQHENMTVTGGRRVLGEENSHLYVEATEGGGEPPPGMSMRLVPANITFSGKPAPEPQDVRDGIIAAYALIDPQEGDLIYTTAFHYLLLSAENAHGFPVTESDIFRVLVTIGGVDYMALQIGPNRLF